MAEGIESETLCASRLRNKGLELTCPLVPRSRFRQQLRPGVSQQAMSWKHKERDKVSVLLFDKLVRLDMVPSVRTGQGLD